MGRAARERPFMLRSMQPLIRFSSVRTSFSRPIKVGNTAHTPARGMPKRRVPASRWQLWHSRPLSNDVVMVGTSSGGMVLCRAAEAARERVSRVVCVDALALFDGERIRDIIQRSTAVPSGLTAGPSREDAETRLFADLDPATRAWALARYALHPIGIYERSVRLTSFWTQPWVATVIWCRRAVNPGEAHQRRTAEQLRAKWFELDTGHYPMLSMPGELTALLTAEA